jgi:hypothetical protein
MKRDEDKKQVSKMSRLCYYVTCQAEGLNQQAWQNETPDHNPCRIKQHINNVNANWRYQGLSLVNYASQNEKPSAYFD